MNYFFDTSALVKYFYKEGGTEIVEKIVLNSDNNIWISELAQIEIISALYKKYRMGELLEKDIEKIVELISQELEFFNIEPLGTAVVCEAINILKTYGKLYGIKTLDALHISTFSLISEEDWIFVAADEVLCKLVKKMGYQVLNPEKN